MTMHAVGAAGAIALAVAVIAARLQMIVPPGRDLGALSEDRRRRPAIRRRRSTGDPTPDDVADWCDFVARALRSGSSLSAAMAAGAASDSAMAPIAATVMRHVDRGEPLVVALDAA